MLQGLYRHSQDEFARHLRIFTYWWRWYAHIWWKVVLIFVTNLLLTGLTILYTFTETLHLGDDALYELQKLLGLTF